MNLLTPSGAAHICASFSANAATSNVEIDDFLENSKGLKTASEGSASFGGLRDLLLREAERSILLSAAKRAAALRSLSESTSPWTFVGLYYACFFSARAILALHGGWFVRPALWLEVSNGSPGQIELSVRRRSHVACQGFSGSHRCFWMVFYQAVQGIVNHVPPNYAHALQPILNSPTWLINTRNDLNYRSTNAFKHQLEFATKFNPAGLPSCLPGAHIVVDNAASALQGLASHLRLTYALSSDVGLPRFQDLSSAIDGLIKPSIGAALLGQAETSISTQAY